MLHKLINSDLMMRQQERGLMPRFGTAQMMSRQAGPALQLSTDPSQRMGQLELFRQEVLPKSNLYKPLHQGRLDVMG